MLYDIVSGASGRATPGLLSQLARTRREILPSSVNRPWAGSSRYKISELMSFTAGRPLPVDSPSLPFWVRFKKRLRRMPYTHTATLDTERAANAYHAGSPPACHQTISSPHVHGFVMPLSGTKVASGASHRVKVQAGQTPLSWRPPLSEKDIA